MLATAIVSVGAQRSWTGTVEVTQTATPFPGGTITVRSIANVSFRWNAGQDAYTPNGNVGIDYNLSNTVHNPPCFTTASGGGSVVDADGELRITSVPGQPAYYFGSGSVSRTLLLRGTTTCNDTNTPTSIELNETGFLWWPYAVTPSNPFGYQLKNNGTVMDESVVSANTSIRWLLRRDP